MTNLTNIVKPLVWHQISAEPLRWMGHQADASNP